MTVGGFKGTAGVMPTVPAVTAALRAAEASAPEIWAPLIVAACERHGINTPSRVAAFIGNILHETGGLKSLVESLDYAWDRLVPVFGAHRITAAQAELLGRHRGEKSVPVERQQKIANIVYGGAWGLKNLGNKQPNDGWFFRGKGAIQLTGRRNHTRFATAIGVDVVTLQGLLETKEGAVDSAASFWSKAGCNECADCGDLTEARRIVNGGALGLAEVKHKTAVVLNVLLAA